MPHKHDHKANPIDTISQLRFTLPKCVKMRNEAIQGSVLQPTPALLSLGDYKYSSVIPLSLYPGLMVLGQICHTLRASV